MRILLIKPRWFEFNGVYKILNRIRFTPLHLGILAALSPGHEVRVIDADWDPIPYQDQFDLVGITVTTFTSTQAYTIAEQFKQTGAKVVMGGAHASLLPEECLQYADAVVIGEAEYVWPEILNDVATGSLKKTYQSSRVVDMNDVPFPKRELLHEQDWVACIQATRGCPHTCAYCYLPSVPWASYRKRDIELVYQELSRMRQQVIFFVDDNMFADEDYAIALFNRIAPLKKLITIQAPTTIARNPKLVEAMANAGCFYLQMGFQTVNPRSLEWASINQNKVSEYKKTISLLHQYKMLITGFFMFGFDTDTPEIFKQTTDMVKEMDLDYTHFYILTLYPGTKLYTKFKQENRVLEDKERTCYGWTKVMFKPASMTPEQLELGVAKANDEIHWHYVKKLPRKLVAHTGLMLREPNLLLSVLGGVLRK
ncbi:MAG: radical SAM protein [bacterium]